MPRRKLPPIHPMLMLVVTSFDAFEQDVIQRLCKGVWKDVTVVDDYIHVRGRKTVFKVEPEPDELEQYFQVVEVGAPETEPETAPQTPPAPPVQARTPPKALGKKADGPTHCLWDGKPITQKPGGRIRLYCDDTCRRQAGKARRAGAGSAPPAFTPAVEDLELPEEPEPAEDPPTPVVAPAVVEPPPEPPPGPVQQRRLWCVRCGKDGHFVEDCTQPVRRVKLTEARHDPGERDRSLIREARSESPYPDELRDVSGRQRSSGVIRLPAPLPPEVGDEELASTAMELRERWAEGLPPTLGVEYKPDVLALYGVDQEMMESTLRAPERVEVRPESWDRIKRYVVLGFYRGDVTVILGCKLPSTPAVIAVYVSSRLEHDIHRVNYSGGGGKREVTGLPSNPRQVVNRLRAAGAQVELDESVASVPVSYKGQDLGKISTSAGKQTAESDFQRMIRKMTAIDQRVTA